jgi:ribosomal protein S18 acetylase RimI-like enzyme
MRTANALDIPAIRTVLAHSYASDPLMQWIFPDEKHRLNSIAAWLGLFLDLYMPAQRVYVVDDPQVTATAVWRFPGDPPLPADILPTVSGLLAALIGTERAADVADGLHAISSVTPAPPFAYLQILAVHPDQQRRGHGSELLRAGIAQSQRLGLGVHLETTHPDNLPFYEAHGFTVTGSLRVPSGGPDLWAMRRPADTDS